MSPTPCIHLELSLWGYYRWSKISVSWSNHPVEVASGWLMVDMPIDGWHEHKMFTNAHRCASGLICWTLTHPYQTWSTMKNKISVTRGRTIEGKIWFTASTTIVIGDIVAGEVFERKPVVAILVVLANDPKMIQPVIIWPDRRIVRCWCVWCVWAGMNWVNQSYWNCGSVKYACSLLLWIGTGTD